jgi:hypothetical protein
MHEAVFPVAAVFAPSAKGPVLLLGGWPNLRSGFLRFFGCRSPLRRLQRVRVLTLPFGQPPITKTASVRARPKTGRSASRISLPHHAMLTMEIFQMMRAMASAGGSPLLQQGELDFSPAEERSNLKWALALGFLDARR